MKVFLPAPVLSLKNLTRSTSHDPIFKMKPWPVLLPRYMKPTVLAFLRLVRFPPLLVFLCPFLITYLRFPFLSRFCPVKVTQKWEWHDFFYREWTDVACKIAWFAFGIDKVKERAKVRWLIAADICRGNIRKPANYARLRMFWHSCISGNKWLNVVLEHFITFLLLFIIQVFLHFMVTYVIKSKF